MRKLALACLAASLVLTGCAVPKDMVAIGGSKADGTVKMGYEYRMFEQPVVNAEQGKQGALARCAAWGYTDAEAFGGQTSVCNESNSSGCAKTLVTVEYQCTGGHPK